MITPREKWIDRITGLVLAVVALLVYLCTLSDGAYPGRSAALVAQHSGLFYRGEAYSFLWTLAVRAIGALPWGGLAERLNVFSAACGAGCVWFLYVLMAGAVRSIGRQDDETRPGVAAAAWSAGVAAALFLAFSGPFWIASNRAHVASFDSLLLLLVAWLFFRYAWNGPRWLPLVFAFAYGITAVECATAIVFAPLLGGMLLYVMWRRGQMSPLWMLGLTGCALAGLSLYFVAAWDFQGSPGHVAREYKTYWQIIWFIWRIEYLLITRGLPRVGWLIVMFVGIVPWLVSLLVARRALNDERDLTYYALHLLLTAVAVAVLVNSGIAPWPILKGQRFLVTPYLLSASLFGYLAAYWYLVPGTWWPGPEHPVMVWLKRWLGLIIVMPGMALLCIVPFHNLPEVDARPAGVVNTYAAEVLDRAVDRQWIISDGMLDMHLLILAHDRGQDIRTVNIGGGNREFYMNYLRSQLADRPELSSVSHVGMIAMLREWFTTQDDVVDTTAVIWPADLWMAGGYSAVPDGVLFHGVRSPGDFDADGVMAKHEALWDKVVAPLREAVSRETPVEVYADFLLKRLSLAANNLGVFMEDINRPDEAFTAYRKAREINPDNISALLNLNGMLNAGYETDAAASIKSDVKALLEGMERKQRIWSLSRHDGYIRVAHAYAQLGMTWALSGRPGLAVSGMKKALELVPDKSRSRLAQGLAAIYLRQGQNEKGEAIYREVLKEDITNREALLGMFRISLRKGELDKARGFLVHAEEAGIESLRISLAHALLHLRAGDAGQARIVLEELVELQPRLLAAWDLLADVVALQRDEKGLERCIRKMEGVRGSNRIALFAKARLAAMRGDLAKASDYAGRALRMTPGNLRVLEFLMQVDIALQRLDDAVGHAKAALQLDPSNGPGNYTMGTVHVLKGEFTLAEHFLRKCLEIREAPEVLNNLAWILQDRGDYAEAETMVRRAIALDERFPSAWDTLGVILLGQDRVDEAEQALEHTLDLSQAQLPTMLHLAEVRIRLGKFKSARELLDVLDQRRRELQQRDQDHLDEVNRMYYEAKKKG